MRRVQRRVCGRYLAAVALVLVAGGALIARCDEPSSPAEAPIVIRGRVLDDRGEPVAGAGVWLPAIWEVWSDEDRTATATTDATGRYELSLPRAWLDGPPSRRPYTVWAYSPGCAVGAASAYAALFQDSADDVDVRLTAPSELKLLVLGPDGRPLAGARAHPRTVRTPVGYEYLPDALVPLLSATTDAEGRCRLSAVAADDWYSVQVVGEAIGAQVQRLDTTGQRAEHVLHVRAATRVEGRVVADDPAHARDVRVWLMTEAPGGRREREGTIGEARMRVEDGRFLVPAIASGRLSLVVTVDDTLPLRPKLPTDVLLAPGETAQLEVPLVPAVRIEGRVQTEDTGTPLADVELHASYGPNQWSRAVTDAEGRFALYVLPAEVRVQIITRPKGYVEGAEGWLTPHRVPEGVERFEIPPILMKPARDVSARIETADGRPLVGVRVYGVAGNRRYGFSEASDAEGRVTLRNVPVGVEMTYQAREDNAIDELTFEIVSADPLVLRLSTPSLPKAAVRGRVVDADGRPVAGATIRLSEQAPDVLPDGATRGTRVRYLRQAPTDDQGVFTADVEAREDAQYRVLVEGADVTPGGSVWFDLLAADFDVGELVVERLRPVEGRVVDGGGAPLAGVSVLSWGNRSRPLSVVSGADGRFQVDAFGPGTGLLFTEGPDHRFQGWVVTAETSQVELTPTRRDEPATWSPNPAPRLPLDERRRMARELLAPLAAQVLAGEDRAAQGRVLEVLARIDPAAAWEKLRAGDPLWNRDSVKMAVAAWLREDDPQSAWEVAQTIEADYWRRRTSLETIDGLPDREAALRRRLLAEALLDARRTIEPRDRVWALAEIASRLLDQGAPDAARQILDECVTAAVELDAAGVAAGHITAPAAVLARVDLEAALRLVESVADETQRNYSYGRVASAVAAADPAAAERVLGLISERSGFEGRVAVCRLMAAVDSDRARRLALAQPSSGMRGITLGQTAEVVAARDPAAAEGLADEALQELSRAAVELSDGLFAAPSAAVWAAALLPTIERAAPDRLPDYLWRALSLRWHARTATDLEYRHAAYGDAENDVALGLILARYDADAARAILRPLWDEFPRRVADMGERFYERDTILLAAAAVDPPRVPELLAALPQPQSADLAEPCNAARLALARALSLDDEGWATALWQAHSEFQYVRRDE